MMRILTILLLPLLFIATSCDSGGEGTACAVDAGGLWEFTSIDIIFSDCTCGDTDCNDAGTGDEILESLECVNVNLTEQNVLVDYCDCVEEETPVRTNEDCTDDAISYSCSDTIINSADGDVWSVSGSVATTTDIQSIEDFISEFGLISLNPEDFGANCMVTTEAQLTKQP